MSPLRRLRAGFRQAQGGPFDGSGQAFGGRGQAFDRFGVSEGGANSGVLKRGGRDTPMGVQAEEEVDRCPLFAADVSGFGVNVSSFCPNVFTLRANVFSLRPNVSSRGRRRLRSGGLGVEVHGRFLA